MSYSLAKLEQSSEKNILVKMSCRLNLNEYLSLHSGSVYKAENIDEDIYILYYNDVIYNEVNSIPTSSQEYYYNKDTKELYVYGTAPSSTDAYFAEFYIYFSSGHDRYLGSDPINSPNVNLRHWQARITSTPILTQTIRNIVDGVLELSISSMSIANSDEYFDKYLGANYSFMNMIIESWHIIGSVENIAYNFIGYISSISKNKDLINFETYDILQPLNKNCVLGQICKTGINRVSPFINIQPSKKDVPIKVYFGKDSPYRSFQVVTAGATSYGPFRAVDGSSLDSAICYGYSQNISLTTNRSYVLGLAASFGFGDGFQNMSAAITATATSGAYSRLTMSVANAAKFSIGDTPRITTNTGTWDLQIIDINYASGYLFVGNAGLFATATSVNDSKVMRLEVLMDDTLYFLQQNTHYTIGSGTYPTGFIFLDYVTVTLINNVEGAVGMPRPINPETDEIKFKIKPKTLNQNHSDVLNIILRSLNYPIESSSFATAKTDLVSNAMFSIPFKDSDDYPSYLEVVQRLLSSSLGYIYLNSNFEIGYSIFKTPSSVVEIDDDDIIDGTFSVSFDYNDIESSISAFNEADDRFNPLVKSTIDAISQNNSYFYKIESEESKFSHILENMTVKIDDHVGLKSNRKIKIAFSSASKLFDSKIGDDIVLKRSILPENVTQMQVKIIEITKLPDRVNVVVTDLKGL
jgi:hypothetical protein